MFVNINVDQDDVW